MMRRRHANTNTCQLLGLAGSLGSCLGRLLCWSCLLCRCFSLCCCCCCCRCSIGHLGRRCCFGWRLGCTSTPFFRGGPGWRSFHRSKGTSAVCGCSLRWVVCQRPRASAAVHHSTSSPCSRVMCWLLPGGAGAASWRCCCFISLRCRCWCSIWGL